MRIILLCLPWLLLLFVTTMAFGLIGFVVAWTVFGLVGSLLVDPKFQQVEISVFVMLLGPIGLAIALRNASQPA